MNLYDPAMAIEAKKVPVPDEVADAVRTLIQWAGDDPSREGLRDTPNRVARAWREYCQGYEEDPGLHLSRTFEEVGGLTTLGLVGKRFQHAAKLAGYVLAALILAGNFAIVIGVWYGYVK